MDEEQRKNGVGKVGVGAGYGVIENTVEEEIEEEDEERRKKELL